MKTKIIKFFLCCLFLTSTFEVFANKTPPHPKPADQPGLPIDGYMLYLLLLGVALGVYFLKRKKSSI